MLKKTLILILSMLTTLTLTACQSYSDMDIYELIDALNNEYSYSFESDDFIIEKKESIIHHVMTDNNSLLSIYSNKKGTIIQCTLSSFNTNNSDLFAYISKILIKCDKKQIDSAIKSAVEYGSYEQNGWKITIIKNDLGITYILNHTNAEINNNLKPTLKITMN